MALEDFADSEVGIAIAATAVLVSPQVRNFLRRSIVFGLAGAMKLGDSLGTAARGVATEVQQTTASAVDAAQNTASEARTTARTPRGAAANKGTPAAE